MGQLDFDVTLPDGSTNTVSELDDYLCATRLALYTFGVLQHDSDGKHKIPHGTTASRNAFGSPPDGMLWINETTGNIDWYDESAGTWKTGFTGAGAGDMLEATYDGDGDGVVESADQITDGGANTVTAAQGRAHIDSVANPHAVESSQITLTSHAGVHDLDELVDGSQGVDIQPRTVYGKLGLLHSRRMAV